MKAFGIILVIFGLVLTIFTAVTFSIREKVVDIGKLEVFADKPHHMKWSPLIGIAVMGIGGIVLWQGSKKR